MKNGNVVYNYKQYDGYNMRFMMCTNIEYMPTTDANNKCGCLNAATGEVTLPFEYDYVGGFTGDHSYSIAVQNGQAGIIDSDGNWLIEPKYDYFVRSDSDSIYGSFNVY